MNLAFNQPLSDSHYSGATIAIFVAGKGLTCDPPPASFKRNGFASSATDNVPDGVYPLYTP